MFSLCHDTATSFTFKVSLPPLLRFTLHRLRVRCVPDLPVTSPLGNAVLKTLESWEQLLLERMNKFDGPPPNYINTFPTDLSAGGGPAILRHKAMLEPDNTPFK